MTVSPQYAMVRCAQLSGDDGATAHIEVRRSLGPEEGMALVEQRTRADSSTVRFEWVYRSDALPTMLARFANAITECEIRGLVVRALGCAALSTDDQGLLVSPIDGHHGIRLRPDAASSLDARAAMTVGA